MRKYDPRFSIPKYRVLPRNDFYKRGIALGITLVVVSLSGLFYWVRHEVGDTATRQHRRNSVDAATSKNDRIRQISILGERNSGTRWTYAHLNECFGHALKVEKKLTRYKHWFQFRDPTRYEHDTLVIAQFRNPYDWFKAMERVPHHAPRHLRTKPDANMSSHESENDWRIFLTRSWTMERVGEDLKLSGDEMCQENFKYRDIVSCVQEPLSREFYNHTLRFSENEPFYEMRNDGSGEPYRNILELRSDKIRNFLSVREYPGVADAWIVQYEFLLEKGTSSLVNRIQEWTGVEAQCSGIPPQKRTMKNSRAVIPEHAAHIRRHLNWTTETLIGYEIEWGRENEETEEVEEAEETEE